MSRRMWKGVESRKADEARVEEARGERGKEREEKANDRRRKNDSEISGRKGECNRVEGDRRDGSKKVP